MLPFDDMLTIWRHLIKRSDEEFWALTYSEFLEWIEPYRRQNQNMTKSALDELMKRFPDHANAQAR